MAENIIKDFVKKQTTPLTIGVPRQRPAEENQQPVQVQPKRQEPVSAPAPAAPETRGHVGRPKSDIEKVKLSVYIPAEAKEKLVKIQHTNYKQSINDVLIEAVSDLIRKYGLQ